MPEPPLLALPDAGRAMGVRLLAGRGAGKSRLLGRVLCWQDFRRGVPTVVIDPLGTTIDHLLDKITRLPAGEQPAFWQRVRYLDMAGAGGHVAPWPLYLRRPGETLTVVAERPLTIWRRLDPNLDEASIMGSNALLRVGKPVGVVLSALGYQITEAADLVKHAERWQDRLAGVDARHPEARPAVAYLREEVLPLTPKERLSRFGTFLNKLADFALDPVMRATYGAAAPAIDWQEVVDRKLLVLFDFRQQTNEGRRRFALMAIFQSLLEFARLRGRAGRRRPLSIVIDELSALAGRAGSRQEALAHDLEELIARLSRNNGVWLCLAHQELNQFNSHIQDVLMTCGTQLLGVTSDPAAARTLAQRFVGYDPSAVKISPASGNYVTVSAAEQARAAGRAFLELPAYHFLAAIATGEGRLPTNLHPFSIARVDAGQHVDEPLVERARTLLSARHGQPLAVVLAEIEARVTPPADAEIAPPGVRTIRRRVVERDRIPG